ncbi:unnamed protein product [Musa textilis]
MEFVKAPEDFGKMQISVDSQVQFAKIKRINFDFFWLHIRCNSEERCRIICISSYDLVFYNINFVPISFRPASVSSIKPIRIVTSGAALGLPASPDAAICPTRTSHPSRLLLACTWS